jgi:fructose-1,6-bisphosphatase
MASKQEQVGSIDAELTIVLSSISMACKQIASLVHRAGISNLTGVQGAVNVQGEDQKKLDVVSNEVSTFDYYFILVYGNCYTKLNLFCTI